MRPGTIARIDAFMAEDAKTRSHTFAAEYGCSRQLGITLGTILRKLGEEFPKAPQPLAFSQEDNPPPGVSIDDWRPAVLAARAAITKARGAANG